MFLVDGDPLLMLTEAQQGKLWGALVVIAVVAAIVWSAKR